jgi:hypothetical protein
MYKKLLNVLLIANLKNNINSMIDEKYSQAKINKIKITDPFKELIEKFKIPIYNDTKIYEIFKLFNEKFNSLRKEDYTKIKFSEEDFINIFTMLCQYRYFYWF